MTPIVRNIILKIAAGAMLVSIVIFLMECNSDPIKNKLYGKILEYIKEVDDKSEIKNISDFLFDNMECHSGMSKNQFHKCIVYHQTWLNSSKSAQEVVDSINKLFTEKTRDSHEQIPDIDITDVDVLWQYVVESYKLRVTKGYVKEMPMHRFLNYVVPYRVGNEPLNLKWRHDADSILSEIKDSISTPDTSSMIATANNAMRHWNKHPFKWTDGLPHKWSLGVHALSIKGGNCKDFGEGAIYLMRYLGIPSGMDMMFAREGEYSSHYWPFVLDEEGKTFFATQDIPYWNPGRQMDLPATKIYRQTFSEHRIFDIEQYDENEIHPRFRNNHIMDVTNEYREVFDIVIPVSDPFLGNGSLVYICNATRDTWMPVGMGIYENKSAKFKDTASSEIACVIAKWDGGELTPICRPFVIDSIGSLVYFKPTGREIQAHIYCKYPLSEKNGDVVDRVIGGRIEGANSKDFRDADLLHQIIFSPVRKITRIPITSDKTYRYVRYVGADSTYCNIAELEIFENKDHENIAVGRPVFGTPGDKSGKGTHEYSNVYDGDLYTSFDYKFPSGGWSAVDLGKPTKITEMAYSPRNRDNYIRQGDLYELFFWNDTQNKWISLGTTMAESDELIYDIPEGGLLFLKNHTRGVNERVFEYDAKKVAQIFH